MLDSRVHELLNQQINKEFYSAYLYLDFSNYFKRVGLDGFANWYKIQAEEERDHAMLFYQYLQNENAEVTLEAIAKPDKEFEAHIDVLKAGLEHEIYVTSLINDIYAAAYDVRDFRTMQFLDWFVKEQGEEETNANDLITKGYVTGKAYLGVSINSKYNSMYAQYYGWPVGAYVDSVTPGSCAETAGIAAGDIITKLGGEEIKSYEDLKSAIKRHSAGESVEVELYRADESRVVSVTFDESVPESA